MEVSVVLPSYNEEKTIREAVERTRNALNRFLGEEDYEIIIAEDGCTDRTPEIAEQLSDRFSSVRHIHSEERLGRGKALDGAFSEAKGEVIVYFDTDLSTDLHYLQDIVEAVQEEGFDISTGSRLLPGHRVERPLSRDIPSKVFNGLVRVVLRSDLRDHQCGFKAFRREALMRLLEDVESSHWFWDTEILVRGQLIGMTIKEIPVEWVHMGDSKVDIIKDSLYFFTRILWMRYRLWMKTLLG